MSYDNRELVEYFLSYKLAQRNYPPSLLRPEEPGGCTEGNQKSPAAVNGLALRSRSWSRSGASPSTGAGIKAVHAALRDSAEEFEKLFAQAFSDLSSQLVITPDTAYQSFKNVMDEVFKDEVNWGRIVGLFAFGGALSVESAEKGASELVCRIADWMTIYLDEHINPWIQNQGGWDRFAKIFGKDAAAEGRRARGTLSRWMLGGLALLTGVLVGVFIVKKL